MSTNPGLARITSTGCASGARRVAPVARSAAVLAFVLCFGSVSSVVHPPSATADDSQQFEVNGGAIKAALEKAGSKKATVRLRGGEELTGVVSKVGDEAVHLSGLSGRDFYDAIVRLSDISAVILNVRGGK